jgi:hypothetical protein
VVGEDMRVLRSTRSVEALHGVEDPPRTPLVQKLGLLKALERGPQGIVGAVSDGA